MNIETIPIELLNPDPNQPRKSWPEADEVEMSNSLINIGQQVPLIVFKDADKNIVADGERRLRAGKRAQLRTMLAIVLATRPDESQLLMLQLTVNCMRSDLLPMEKTEAYSRLMASKGISATELAKQLGVSKSNITRYLSHANLPDELQTRLRDGTLSSAKAYALSRMTDEQRRQATEDLQSDFTRDDLERMARKKTPKRVGSTSIRNLRYELPDCTLALRASKSMTVDSLIDALADLLKACRRAKSQKLDLGTMALVVRDRTRAAKTPDEQLAQSSSAQ